MSVRNLPFEKVARTDDLSGVRLLEDEQVGALSSRAHDPGRAEVPLKRISQPACA